MFLPSRIFPPVDLLFLLAFLVFLSGHLSESYAEDVYFKRAPLEWGLDVEAVRSRLGEPEGKALSEKNVLVIWRYGKSQVFFDNGHVSAWSDAGELSSRARVKQFATKKATREKFRKQGWVRDWKRTPPVESDEVLESIMGEP